VRGTRGEGEGHRDVKIAPLAEHREMIPALSRLLHEEWRNLAPWRDLATIEARLERSARMDSVPIAFVAIEDGGEPSAQRA